MSKICSFFILLLLVSISCIDILFAQENNDNNDDNEHSQPRIIIIGAGAAGIAAASKLFENGFNNVTVLEAEDRAGGRVYSKKFGPYLIDMGGQWVHGEKGNIAFELAWPLGLLERFGNNDTIKIFTSNGLQLKDDLAADMRNFHMNISSSILKEEEEEVTVKSFGEYADSKYAEYFKAHAPMDPGMLQSILYLVNLLQMASDGGDDWYEVSAKGLQNYKWCEGDPALNWKERTYGTILDIVMKKYPDPEKELPVLNNTILNTKVTNINYDTADGITKLTTKDGNQYSADHVIFTASLGVLKADYEQLFNPPLSDKKISTIKNLGMGHVAKIYLYYDNPWWMDGVYAKCFFWTLEDKTLIERDENKKWWLGVYMAMPVEHKPNLLCLWMSGRHSKDMEKIPEDVFQNKTLELINLFFGQIYNVTQPSMIIRSTWNLNENFQGTYSFRSLASDEANVNAEDLAEPIIKNGKPILQFAGEATDQYYSTVHGAIDSGFREADRLINYYSTKKKLE